MRSLVTLLSQHLHRIRPLQSRIAFTRSMSGTVDHVAVGQNDASLKEMVRHLAPPLSYESHKGQAGRIGVVGGSSEYTGAPYYSAITALRAGCDLVHVFCTSRASACIKSYNPELIVHPLLDQPDCISEITTWMQRLHAMVVGPGLGRDGPTLSAVTEILEQIKAMNIPVVIDADGLYLVTENPSVIRNYRKAILTPNAVEFARLYKVVAGTNPNDDNIANAVSELSNMMGNVTILRKGEMDIISDGNAVLTCRAEGSPRRCGGQGDVLCGSLGTYSYWGFLAMNRNNRHFLLNEHGPTLCSSFAACLLTRECNRRAYQKKKRSTITTDMIEELPTVVSDLFGP